MISDLLLDINVVIDIFQANARKNLFAVSKLLRILSLLEEKGIKALPFKGPVLASVLYENPGLRCYGDLDILIAKSDFLFRPIRLMKKHIWGFVPPPFRPQAFRPVGRADGREGLTERHR